MTTGKSLFPVKIWDGIITGMDLYLGTIYKTKVNTVKVDNTMIIISYNIITRLIRSRVLSFGEDCIGFYHEDVGT